MGSRKSNQTPRRRLARPLPVARVCMTCNRTAAQSGGSMRVGANKRWLPSVTLVLGPTSRGSPTRRGPIGLAVARGGAQSKFARCNFAGIGSLLVGVGPSRILNPYTPPSPPAASPSESSARTRAEASPRGSAPELDRWPVPDPHRPVLADAGQQVASGDRHRAPPVGPSCGGPPAPPAERAALLLRCLAAGQISGDAADPVDA